MKKLKPLLLSSLLILLATAGAQAEDKLGGPYEITKDLVGATGSPYLASADYALGYAWGEPAAGNISTNGGSTLISGYYGGHFGNAQAMTFLGSTIDTMGATAFYQDQMQVGVPYNATIQLRFSDELDGSSILNGVHVVIATDHMGNSSNTVSSFTYTFDPVNHSITIAPSGAWLGNTLYDIQLTPDLLSVDEFQLDQIYHVYFLTILDHHQENVVLNPIAPNGNAALPHTATMLEAMSIDIPTESLANYSAVLTSRDPLHTPLRVDPKIIQAANDKARDAGGPYRVPLAIQEINAYDENGNLMGRLSKPAAITLNYGSGFTSVGAGSTVIRPQTLSFWVLDEAHSLWVKIPASQNAAAFQTVSAPVTNFSVFALMGDADGSAGDSYAFPVPWRPHGPNAGTGAGRSGTEGGGITFAGIPSECKIKIYTISGELVRELEHSDTGGPMAEEVWDVKTKHGENAASGVYLWRVESSVDGKNGKLMVIR